MGACVSSLTVHEDFDDSERTNTQLSTSSCGSSYSSASTSSSNLSSSADFSDVSTSSPALSPLGNELRSSHESEGRPRKKSLLFKRTTSKRKEKQHVLLLGASGSGKTTLMKQVRMMHNNGHCYEERVMYKKIILNTVVRSIQNLIGIISAMAVDEASLTEYIKIRIARLSDLKEVDALSAEEVESVATLWQQRIFQDAYEANSSQFCPTITYFMKNIEEIAGADYIPTEQDILMVGRKTVGICAMELKLNGVLLRVVDVGGQRKERKKWAHFFDGVTAVVFCVSLADYDQVLEEDQSANRMRESLQLFGDMLKEEKLKNSSIILFLNKKDVFQEKIAKQNITTAFPAYKGAQEYEEALEYIKQQFLSLNSTPEEREIFCHTTCAVDPADMRSEWSSTLQNIFFKKLSVVF